jgi:uncharacterized membrane protein
MIEALGCCGRLTLEGRTVPLQPHCPALALSAKNDDNSPTETDGGIGMGELIIAGILFPVAHLGISSTPLRGWLVGKIGANGYLGVFSLIAAATLVYLIMAYADAPPAEFLWAPTVAMRWVALLVMPIAMILLLGGFLAPNPTGVGMEDKIKTVGEGTGLTRITRHPLQWSFVLWAVVHVLANGDASTLILCASIAATSFFGTFLMDRKKAATLGEDWARYAAVTSNLPFGAIASGRNRLVAGELVMPVIIGLAGYVLALWGHQWLSGGVALLP